MKHAGWKTLSSKEVYKNPWVVVREDIVKDERGDKKIFGVMNLPEGSSILPIDPNGNVYLVKQFRYGFGDYTVEVPGGQIDAGESAEISGKRELFEELGITAEALISLGFVAGLTSNIQHKENLFLAILTDVPKIILESEEEVIEYIQIPFQTAVEWAVNGRIVHAPAVAHILRANEYFKK